VRHRLPHRGKSVEAEAMTRLITRYRGGSRKLYDTTESRYISLEEIPDLIRRGDVLRVVDSRTGTNVTAQVLAQVISESEKRGVSFLTAEALHEIIRTGEQILAASLGRLPVAHRTRREFDLLRRGLRRLQRSLTLVDDHHRTPRRPRRRSAARTVRSARPRHSIRTEGEEP
jgi:polyhydroxyalkanoate synthesis repressor PhaR